MTHVLQVELAARGYPVRIGPQLLASPESYSECVGRPLRLITDEHLAPLYAATVSAALGIGEDQCLVLPAGEEHKNWATAERVLDWLLATHLPRDGVLVALGGGVIGLVAVASNEMGLAAMSIPPSVDTTKAFWPTVRSTRMER